MTDSAKQSNKDILYKAATEAIVAESTQISTYEKIAEVAENCSGSAEFSKIIKETEKIIKKEFGLDSMPGPWRSAKSVVLNAKTLEILLFNPFSGKLKGKSFLQDEIKTTEEARKIKKSYTYEIHINKILEMINKPPHGLEPDILKGLFHKQYFGS